MIAVEPTQCPECGAEILYSVDGVAVDYDLWADSPEDMIEHECND